MRHGFCLAIFAAALASASAPAGAYTTLFAFGDSLSDAGNDYIFDGKTDPVPPYYNGHFSNGPTWVEDLNQKLGFATPLTPSLAGGHDYAFGGAQTGPTDIEKIPNPGDLLGQVQQYALKYPQYQGALYTFDIGGNDIMNALGAYAPGDVMTYAGFNEITKVVSQAEANTASAVKELWGLGARNLLFYEVPDLGMTPRYRGTALQSWASYFALSFDQTVLNDIRFLKSFPYNVKEYTLDTYHLLDDVIGQPDYFYTNYGIKFTDVTDPCWTGNFTSATSGSVCANPNQYLLWDRVHPTFEAHLLTADLAYSALAGGPSLAATFATRAGATVPEPSTWALMALGFVGLACAAYQRRCMTISRRPQLNAVVIVRAAIHRLRGAAWQQASWKSTGHCSFLPCSEKLRLLLRGH